MEFKSRLSERFTKIKPKLRSIFLFRNTRPLFAVFQALFTMGLVLLLPAFEIIHFVEDTVEKVQEAKIVIEAALEEIPCEIEDYVLQCDNGEDNFVFDFAEAGSTIADTVTGAYDNVVLFFQDDKVQYVVDGVVEVTIEYTDISENVSEKLIDIRHFKNKLDKYFKYAKAIYSHKHLITKTTVILLATIVLSISMLLYLIVVSGLILVLAIILNRILVKKGIGELRHRRKMFIAAAISSVIPTLLIGIIYIITGSFMIELLFIGTVITMAYTLKTNEQIKIL